MVVYAISASVHGESSGLTPLNFHEHSKVRAFTLAGYVVIFNLLVATTLLLLWHQVRGGFYFCKSDIVVIQFAHWRYVILLF